jgi:hypothetical protein
LPAKLTDQPHMTEPAKYQGTYTDDFGTTDITIINDFKNISLKIDDVEFKGSEFTALEIVDKNAHSTKHLERFTLYATRIYGTDDFVEELCNCTFDITVPQFIIDLQTQEHFLADLKLKYIIGKARPETSGGIEFEKIYITVKFSDNLFESQGYLFESIFENIQNQFDGKYKLKNCFGCLYSDYSAYGQSALGSMMCFINQKEKYLDVKSKTEYMDNLTNDYEVVQEIFCCDKFEVRRKGTGYRG